MLMHLPDSSILTNISFAGNAKMDHLLFEKKYISIRTMENRMYTDEEVKQLPGISRDHTHYAEWHIRKRSARRISNYLAAKKKNLHILEVGCGNGWLSHLLSLIPGAEVTGLDINFTELQQAARVFSNDKKLRFIYGDISTGIRLNMKFDIIVFAASLQYFRFLGKVMDTCFEQLKPGGEIHITDSHFYRSYEIAEAKTRTADYYTSLGYPEMTAHYFHHDLQDLQAFHPDILYNPYSVMNRFLRHRDPFHWICIKND